MTSTNSTSTRAFTAIVTGPNHLVGSRKVIAHIQASNDGQLPIWWSEWATMLPYWNMVIIETANDLEQFFQDAQTNPETPRVGFVPESKLRFLGLDGRYMGVLDVLLIDQHISSRLQTATTSTWLALTALKQIAERTIHLRWAQEIEEEGDDEMVIADAVTNVLGAFGLFSMQRRMAAKAFQAFTTSDNIPRIVSLKIRMGGGIHQTGIALVELLRQLTPMNS